MAGVDLTISLGVIVQTGVLVVGGIAALVTMRNTVQSLKVEAAVAKVDVEKQFVGIRAELQKMTDILIGQARFEERLSSLDRRVTQQGKQIDELRHGDGFVLPRRAEG